MSTVVELPVRRQADRPRRRRWRTAAAAAGLVIVTAAVTVTLTRHGHPATMPAASPPPVAVAPPAAAPAPAPLAVAPGQSAEEWTVPTTAPAVTWRRYGGSTGVFLPYSDGTDGPTRITGAVASGYAHTPTGALLAAIQIPARYALASDWRPVIEQGVVPGVGRDRLEQIRAGISDTSADGGYSQPAAFAFVAPLSGGSGGLDTVVLQLVNKRPSDGVMSVWTVTMRWLDNDWKVQLQPSGAVTPAPQQLRNLTGYVPFGPA